MSQENSRVQRRKMLGDYYGELKKPDTPNILLQKQSPTNRSSSSNAQVLDIDTEHFQPNLYLKRLMKEKKLEELIDGEHEMIKQIRSLDSDMQTLVYENYNKFIRATDTIKQMKSDFCRMEEEMECLASNIGNITESSSAISETLQTRRQQISKLASVHSLLKKLQFLFELPARLRRCIEMEANKQAVTYYCKAKSVLVHYRHMHSFAQIEKECLSIVEELKVSLWNQFRNNDCSTAKLTECIDLILQLGDSPSLLCSEYISQSKHNLDADLSALHVQILDLNDGESLTDILEFVDCATNRFLTNLSVVVVSYLDLFSTRIADQNIEELIDFSRLLMNEFLGYCSERLMFSATQGDNGEMLTRVTDRLYRKVISFHQILPQLQGDVMITDLISRVAYERLQYNSHTLENYFDSCIIDLRQNLTMPVTPSTSMPRLLADMQTSLLERLRMILLKVQLFAGHEGSTMTLLVDWMARTCSLDRSQVRDKLLDTFLRAICSKSAVFCDDVRTKGGSPALSLILSRFCHDLHSTRFKLFYKLFADIFPGSVEVSVSLISLVGETAQRLLDHYVKQHGMLISDKIRVSIETKDWMASVQPKQPRAVVKRIIDDLTLIDSNVGALFEDGQTKAHSSDSSRHQSYSRWAYNPATNADSNLIQNIQKLFSEKIEVFSPVQFNRVSAVTGIIKLAMRTLLECIRCQTFGKFGLQQIQVDCHYLQMYLWRFVNDDKLINNLRDEIVGSAIQRSLDTALLDPVTLDSLCDKD